MAAKKSRRFLKYLAAEREAGQMYRALAELTEGERREALLELATIEDRHAKYWEQKLLEAGLDVPAYDGELDPLSAEVLDRARRFSLDAVLPELEAAELMAQTEYDAEPDAIPGMAGDERIHARVLRQLQTLGPNPTLSEEAAPESDVASAGSSSRPAGLGSVPKLAGQPKDVDQVRQALNAAEPWHRTDRSGSMRAAVFGASDGLVSNTALVMGFAGAGAAVSSGTVLFAGLAGLLAGAFSMGAGEFVSVSSQRDLFTRELALEAQELREKPQEEQRELELLYRAKGLDRDTARQVAASIMADPKNALDTLAREELGLDPDALGSPVRVAISSFASFTVGAVVPVVPYLFMSGPAALVLGVVLAVLALLLVGGVVGRLSGAGVLKSSARQLAVGGGAAAVTFVVGHFVGGGIA